MKLTQERLRELLYYNPEQGEWLWITPPRRRVIENQRAGTIKDGGPEAPNWKYRYININGHQYRSARLAFLYMTGRWPDIVDHIDRDGLNDRWSNLRECTKTQNAANTKLHRHNSSGFRGVSWHSPTQTWRAQIVVSGKAIGLGFFKNKENAALAYNFAAVEAFGEFARLNVASSTKENRHHGNTG